MGTYDAIVEELLASLEAAEKRTAARRAQAETKAGQLLAMRRKLYDRVRSAASYVQKWHDELLAKVRDEASGLFGYRSSKFTFDDLRARISEARARHGAVIVDLEVFDRIHDQHGRRYPDLPPELPPLPEVPCSTPWAQKKAMYQSWLDQL